MPETKFSPGRSRRLFAVMMLSCILVISVVTAALSKNVNWTQESLQQFDAALVTWTLISSALVLLMTPGIGFFYGGLVRSRNMHSTLLLSLITLGVVVVLWVFVGFSLSFGDNALAGMIGNPASFSFFRSVGADASYLAPTIPVGLFALFQLMFAIVTAALITGSFVERVNTAGYVVFIIFWHLVVYCPMAHMVWHPQGLIHKFRVIDFAGGMVVHMASGFTALAGSIFLGASKVKTTSSTNVPYVILGTTFLWFGWFGFNGGSAVAGNGSFAGSYLAVLACLNTTLAAGSSMLSWISMESILHKAGLEAKEACFGVVVGLVAITPAAGYVNVGSACCIGIISGSVCKLAQVCMQHSRYLEDNLDVFACHGVGGVVGVICTSLFATKGVNPQGEYGLFYGSGTLFWRSIVTATLVAMYVSVASYACYWAANAIIPLRVPPELEILGLDTNNILDPSVVMKHSNIEDIIAVLNASIHGSRRGPEQQKDSASNNISQPGNTGLNGTLARTTTITSTPGTGTGTDSVAQYAVDLQPDYAAPTPFRHAGSVPVEPKPAAGFERKMSLAMSVEAPVVR